MTGERCVNTRRGHSKGHQSRRGKPLKNGYFVASEFDAEKFLQNILASVRGRLKEIAGLSDDSNEIRRQLTEKHRRTLRSAPERSFWFTLRQETRFPGDAVAPLSRLRDILSRILGVASGRMIPSVGDPCFSCLFGRPEYKFPCDHYLCYDCVIDFGQQDHDNYTFALHGECVICAMPTLGPGYKIPVRPQLSGVRILSLNGGGARGVVQLVTLQRLEKLIDLGLPIGDFFDLIVGSSAGRFPTLSDGRIFAWNSNRLTCESCTFLIRGPYCAGHWSPKTECG